MILYLMNKYQKEYIYRINKVIDYIEHNLDGELTLERVSEVANFSTFHFHRIFSAFMGETLSDYIKRKRIEKAASLLISEPDKPITEVAVHCGFNSLAVFCRNFRDHFHTTAQEYRSSWKDHFSKNHQVKSNINKLESVSAAYFSDHYSSQNRRFIMKKNIEIREMPAMDVIYCRHTGKFNLIGTAYNKLFKWAGPRGLLSPGMKCITMYHDDPKITAIDKVRQSACIVINKEVKTEGEIGRMLIAGGKYVVGHFEITDTEFQDAWDSVCLWLSESGYQPEDKNPYELYHNNHEDHPEKKFIVDICIPVKRL